MKIFLDTADLTEIRRASDAGLIDGLTTNPSLVSKVAGDRDIQELYLEICESVEGPVSLEVIAIDRETMVTEGRKLAAIHANAVVKVPLTEDGLKACRDLVGEGHKRKGCPISFAGSGPEVVLRSPVDGAAAHLVVVARIGCQACCLRHLHATRAPLGGVAVLDAR